MSNFKCDKCGVTNIDCGLGVFKTPREIELEKKLKIAEEALKHYANTTMGEEYKKGKFRYLVKRSIDVGTGSDYYLEYDATIAQQALQKMKGAEND